MLVSKWHCGNAAAEVPNAEFCAWDEKNLSSGMTCTHVRFTCIWIKLRYLLENGKHFLLCSQEVKSVWTGSGSERIHIQKYPTHRFMWSSARHVVYFQWVHEHKHTDWCWKGGRKQEFRRAKCHKLMQWGVKTELPWCLTNKWLLMLPVD